MKKIVSWGLVSLSVVLISSCDILTKSNQDPEGLSLRETHSVDTQNPFQSRVPSTTNQINTVAKTNQSQFQGQQLPITAQVNIGEEIIELEVAKTPEEQSKGLMFREALADNRGMFFPFPYPRITRFWMKNCLVPLDMIFLRDGKVVEIAHSVPPCNSAPEDCPVYGPDVLVDGVIELRSGRAKELDLQTQDHVEIEFLDISQ